MVRDADPHQGRPRRTVRPLPARRPAHHRRAALRDGAQGAARRAAAPLHDLGASKILRVSRGPHHPEGVEAVRQRARRAVRERSLSRALRRGAPRAQRERHGTLRQASQAVAVGAPHPEGGSQGGRAPGRASQWGCRPVGSCRRLRLSSRGCQSAQPARDTPDEPMTRPGSGGKRRAIQTRRISDRARLTACAPQADRRPADAT
mmetsp:Transcript_46325/g.121552  ORF Transcript_46325/g.121552 Transcript_46325/m.121552 type:complete len:204 (+) Transcript_46325:1332-1943(+)